VLACAAACAIAGGCATGGKTAIADATSAFQAAEYGRSLALARTAAEGSTGAARGQARYLEGISLLKLKRFDEAVAPLEDASDAPNRALAADARISLGTALIGRGDLAGAADAYRRASLVLDGAEKDRARSIEAECRARLVSKPATQQDAPVMAAPVDRAPPPTTPAPTPSTPTSRIVNGLEVEPILFTIQAGAFRERAKATALAAQLRQQVALQQLSPPRVVEKPKSPGASVFVVQFGSFPNRSVAGKALQAFPQSGYTVERVAE
jgi:tetratricopeptide (TPR) repeat protein